jgi:hypothetical protein
MKRSGLNWTLVMLDSQFLFEIIYDALVRSGHVARKSPSRATAGCCTFETDLRQRA